ncbi:hypothetical protein, partial [Psychromonas sp. Urea-02u-13]|uniref:hypothetical protein n=1 Tax=Psychromonas sp. Urea-02u-13 TaxID=2058326 RepID=UPI000CC82A42
MEIENLALEVLGSGHIYSNGIMQGVVFVDYEATNEFSLKKITLCDSNSLIPLNKDWNIDTQDNGYAHWIEQLEVTPRIKSDITENMPDSPLNRFSVAHFLRTETLGDVDMCVAISGTQRIEQDNGIFEEVPVTINNCNSVEAVTITSTPQISSASTSFSMSKQTISSNKHHDYVAYRLSSNSQLFAPKSSFQFNKGGFHTSSSLTVKSNNSSIV